MFTLHIPVSLAFAIFLTIWFTVLFAVLPLGIRSQAESGEVVPGTDPGAPIAPRLVLKAALTTLLSVVAFFVLVMVLRVPAEAHARPASGRPPVPIPRCAAAGRRLALPASTVYLGTRP